MRNTIALLLLLTGCGYEPLSANQERKPQFPCYSEPSTDSEALPFVQAFYAAAKEHDASCYLVDSVSVTDDDLEVEENKNVVGICYSGSTSRKIVIERKLFTDRPDITAKLVVWHELGHCALNLEHSAQEHMNIMTPSVLSAKDAEENWVLLESKLFKRDLSLTQYDHD